MTELVSNAPSPSWLKRLFGSRLLAALSYPRAADRYVELASPLYARTEVKAEIVAVRPEAPSVVTLTLRPNDNLRPHLAGQYVALTAEIGGPLRTRCFSLSSAPARGDGLVELTIKARPGGAVTPRLVAQARAGQIVTLSQPMGDFVLPDPAPARMLLVSGGSGITPVMAMLRQLVSSGHQGEVVFAHFARSRADVIFGAELEALARSGLPWLRVIVETELEAGKAPDLTAASLSQIAPDFEQIDAWVCGPEPLIAAARRAYAERGHEGRVRFERFALAPRGEPREGETAEVQFRRAGRATSGAPRTLLVMAEEAGLTPPSGCRAGVCHTCKCRKLTGVTRDVRTGELSTDDDVDVQLCVSEPVGDVTLDL